MELRPELMPPVLDKVTVRRLAELAGAIDGAAPGSQEDAVAAFNRAAGTDLTFVDFQGISGGQDHDTWVRRVLAGPHEKRLPDVTRAELVELARRVMEGEGADHEIGFWLAMLELNLPDPRVSDLIFWPGESFGDGDDSRELSPEQVVDVARAGRGDRHQQGGL